MNTQILDREGLKILWRELSLKDYPNNATLMAVIDAIDETKANKSDLEIDYSLLAFDINEIVINNQSATSVLGQAILGQMMLA